MVKLILAELRVYIHNGLKKHNLKELSFLPHKVWIW